MSVEQDGLPASPHRVAWAFATLVLALASAIAWTTFGTGDFSCFYETAATWRRAGIYEPNGAVCVNLNLPHVVVLFAPLTALPMTAAWIVWQGFNLAAFACLLFILPPRPGAGLVVAVCLTPAMLSQTALAQVATVLAVLVTCAWAAERTGRWVAAGTALGAAIALKPFLLPVAAWWAVSRFTKAAAVATITAAGITLAGVALMSPGAYAVWWDAASSASWGHYGLNLSVNGMLSRLELFSLASWTGVVLPIAVVTALAAWGRRGDLEWIAVLTATILITPLGWAYYELILMGPLLAAAGRHPSLRSLALLLWVPPGIVVGGIGLASLSLGAVWGGAIVQRTRHRGPRL